MNYYEFQDDYLKPTEIFFPKESVTFSSLGEAILFCGLSHFSAVTVSRAAALSAAPDIARIEAMQSSRGIFHAYVIGAAVYGTGPMLFCGERHVATRPPAGPLDYEVVKNTCIDFVNHLKYWKNAGYISDYFFDRKIYQLSYYLPKAIMNQRIQYKSSINFYDIVKLSKIYFKCPYFYLLSLPLLLLPRIIIQPIYYLGKKIVRYRRGIRVKRVLSKENR